MSSPSMSARKARFGPYVVDFLAGELRKNGRKIRLQVQPLQILAMLVERPGEVVTREELRQRLWPTDTFVDFDHGLNNAINKLRDALNDSADAPRFIETLPRRGYRFIGELETPVTSEVDSAGSAKPDEAAAQNVVQVKQRRTVRYWVWALTALAALLVGGVLLRYSSSASSNNIRSIAVLPFANLSGDPSQDYFADGMTEALITNLAQVRALRVISRTSAMHYKGTSKTLPEIARELNVDAVIDGAVRRSGNRIQVTAQLVNGKTDLHLWAKTFERDSQDVLVMQSELARAIASEINVRLTAREQQYLANARPVNPDAYNAYLLGNFHAAKKTPESIAKAIDYFQQAIRFDPDYAQAYTGLANTYFEQEIWGGLGIGKMEDQIRANTLRAIALDPELAEAHLLLARIHFQYDWDWERTEAEFKRAIELNANLPGVYDYYAFFLQAMGRHQEALEASHRAVELDPLSPWYLSDEGRILFRARQYERAVACYQRALELDPAYGPALARMTDAYTEMGKYDDALTYIIKLRQVAGDSNAGSLSLLLVYARTGRQREALAGLATKPRDGALDHDVLGVASVYAALGDHARAITVLEKGVAARSVIAFVFADPRLDPLRSDPRFHQLLRRVNLPS